MRAAEDSDRTVDVVRNDGSVGVSVRALVARTPEVEAAIALSKRHQATLGQLPFSVFHDAARDGHLLGAFDQDGNLVGYVLYRIAKRTSRISITHLCVDASVRGRGAARLLVDEVAARHPHLVSIFLYCRSDYDAHDVWPSLGFNRDGRSKTGRGRDKRTLILWTRPINERTLFTYDPDVATLPAAALDTNVFRDIMEPRHDHPTSLALTDSWLEEVVEYVVVPELLTEVARAAESAPALIGTSERFKHLKPTPEQWEPLRRQFAAALAGQPIGEGDLRQLAQAAAGGATFFVTRDDPVLKAATRVEEMTGLRVLAPDDLLRTLHADVDTSAYQPASLRETRFTLVHPTVIGSRTTLTGLTVPNERQGQLRAEIDAVSGTRDGRLWSIERPDGARVALAATTVDSDGLAVRVLRVADGEDKATFSRQLAHLLREHAVDTGLTFVHVYDAPTPQLVAALTAEGFKPDGQRWTAHCVRRLCTVPAEVEDLAHVPPGQLTPELVSQLEREHWPAKIVTGLVPTYVVPIRPEYAEALFGGSPQPSLLGRPEDLGLLLEHCYYKAYNGPLPAPGRVLWWVSGGKANGGFRAVSWLDDSQVDRPRTLFRRFGRQGVYTVEQVESLVRRRGGKASVLLFSRTELFPTPISLEQARTVLDLDGKFLRTTRTISEHVFAELYRLGGLAA